MITFSNVTKVYSAGLSKKKVTAVNDVSFQVGQGEILGIIGPNGAGKSTVIKMLMGFISPGSGTITVLGKPSTTTEVRKNIGYLPENPYYYDHLSAEELLLFSGRASGMDRKRLDERMDELLEHMNLLHAKKRKLRTYSKGMTQRAGICFALIHDPDLIILDEPMSGLDPLGRNLVVNLIFELKKRKKTVLFCSHILNDVERLCDKMAIMDNGELKRILSRDMIQETYGLATMTLDTLPDEMGRALANLGQDIHQNKDANQIISPKHRLAECLNIISTHKVNVVRIEQQTDVLETIFLDTIKNRYLHE